MALSSQDGLGDAECRRLPLDVARECFGWLVTGPDPLALDGRPFAGLPDRTIPLDELRDRLLRRDCPKGTRDAVWGELVSRTRSEGASWTVACAGMALPMLASTARWLSVRYPDGDPFDVHAEVLTGFLDALARIEIGRPHVLARLRWAAFRAGMAALREALDAPTPLPPGYRSTPPHPPWGHPDLVLARAVREGVLTPTEADLIGSTRLEDVAVGRWAAEHDTTIGAAYKSRRRAEHRLAAYLRQAAGDVDDSDPVSEYVASRLADPTPPTARQSPRNVTPSPGGERAEQTGIVAGAVSKAGADSGLFSCGPTTPDRPDDETSEVPRCA
ncbi:hypothetical protein ACTWP5_18940 [Streptomyces sp. 4N509B]|uniref:hypothetical protein n=1 Tax=Streptomyces sp. 4N509B TaxID=3457413 RepID=UPI003FD043F7